MLSSVANMRIPLRIRIPLQQDELEIAYVLPPKKGEGSSRKELEEARGRVVDGISVSVERWCGARSAERRAGTGTILNHGSRALII